MDPKAPTDHRTDRIPIRVTPAQKAVLAEAAARSGLDTSSWLRALGMERAAQLGITETTVKAGPTPKSERSDGRTKGRNRGPR